MSPGQLLAWIALIGATVWCIHSLVTSKSKTRFETDRLGMIFCIGGVLLIVLGLAGALLPVPGLGAILFWPGAGALVSGMVIWRRATRKNCPQCGERVNVKASRCPYCGREFAAEPARAAAS